MLARREEFRGRDSGVLRTVFHGRDFVLLRLVLAGGLEKWLPNSFAASYLCEGKWEKPSIL